MEPGPTRSCIAKVLLHRLLAHAPAEQPLDSKDTHISPMSLSDFLRMVTMCRIRISECLPA